MNRKRRIRRTASDWRQVLAKQKGSGQSGVGFCRNHGIGLKGFYRAKSKYGKPPAEKSFVQVTFPRQAAESAAAIRIELSQGRIELNSAVPATWVATLFKALSA